MLLLMWSAPATATPEPPIVDGNARPHWLGQFSRDYIAERPKRIEETEQTQPIEQTQPAPVIKPITLPNVAEFMKARGVELPTTPVTPLELPAEDTDDDVFLAWFILSAGYGKIITD